MLYNSILSLFKKAHVLLESIKCSVLHKARKAVLPTPLDTGDA